MLAQARHVRAMALALLALALLAALAPAPAAAHPLGNFSVNRYTRIEAGGRELRLRYLIDMAEIPTFQELSLTDGAAPGPAELAAYADRLAERLADGLRLEADGRRLALHAGERSAELRPGQGGLHTLAFQVELAAALPDGRGPWQISYEDAVFGDRTGWAEVVVLAGPGGAVSESSAPAADISRELSSYPEALLLSPPAVSAATFRLAPGGAGAPQVAEAVAPAPRPADDQLSRLVSAPISGPISLAGALLTAAMLGAAHALAPGHGKTIVGAYLVGARGSVAHALFLGLTTTVTHTAGVFALGLATLFVSRWVLPEQLYPWLGALSGALVFLIGATLLRERLGALLGRAGHGPGALDERGGHTHGFGYHTHAPAVSTRGLLALGVSGGLLPCPSALVVLLGAIALGRPALGLLLVLAFSVGLAGVLTGIGVALVRARGLFERLPAGGRLLPGLGVAGAAVVTVAGVGITLQALAEAGLLR